MKPSNVLLDANLNIKVSDFGLGSFFAESNKLNTPCGSPCFAAPEVISGLPYQPEPYDMWGLGVILYNLLTGVLPFDEPTKTELYAKIRGVSYNIPPELPVGALRIIKRLLVRDPTKRMKLSEVWQEEWIQRGGVGQILSHFKKEEFKLGKLI
jgi:serine/threonine protein kinase